MTTGRLTSDYWETLTSNYGEIVTGDYWETMTSDYGETVTSDCRETMATDYGESENIRMPYKLSVFREIS